MIPPVSISDDEWQTAWAAVASASYGNDNSKKCECGASKIYAKEPNLEYLHSDWCPLYLDPNWIRKLNEEMKNAK